jgi:hypothetical protein
MKHHATLFGEYDIAMRIRVDMFGKRMQNRIDYRDQFPNHKEWKRVNNKIRKSPNLLFECMRPRNKRIDFCIFGSPTILWNNIDHLINNFYRIATNSSKCADKLLVRNWPVYSENIIACSMIDLGMSLEKIG